MLPTYHSILYATDLSESARQALRHAVSLAGRYDASLTILHVVPDLVDLMSEDAGFDIESHFGSEDWKEINARTAAKAQDTARERIREMASECVTDDARCPVANAVIKIKVGDPTEHIMEEITIAGHDLVIMGAHGWGAFMNMLLGSVANKIVRLSPVPVLTVRLPHGQDGKP